MIELIVKMPPMVFITTTIGTNAFYNNSRVVKGTGQTEKRRYVMPEGGRHPFNIITKEVLE